MAQLTIERLAFPTDVRGLVIEPIGLESLPHQKNAHLVLTEPGHIRGNHYHRHGTEIAVVLGPALVRYRDGDAIKELEVAEGTAYRLTIPPGIAHAFKNTGSGPMVIISFNTVVHDRAAPDVARDVLIES